MRPYRFQTRVRFIDTDASGRIHYTAMFRYFESAEIEWMRELGISYIGSKIGLPRVRVECDFRKAIAYDDLLEIEVRLTKLGGSSFRLEFAALRAGVAAAQGAVVIACMDRETGQAIPIPDEMRGKLEGVLEPAPNRRQEVRHDFG